MTRSYFAFPISAELHDRARRYIDGARRDPRNPALHPLLNEITEESLSVALHHFLIHSMEMANVSRISRNAASMAINTAKRGIFVVSRRVINGLSAEQMGAIADFLDETLIEPHEQYGATGD